MRSAQFITEPALFARHAKDSEFIGAATFHLGGNRVLMFVTGGRPPVTFDSDEDTVAPCRRYVSDDGGRTWQAAGLFPIEQTDGQPAGVNTVLRLRGARLAFQCCQGRKNNHGGGLYTLHISDDDGESIREIHEIGGRDGVYYVQSERLIQMSSGRLVMAASHMPAKEGSFEGDDNVAQSFYSDDGKSWHRSRQWSAIPDGGNGRGMQECCAVEVDGGRLMLLARTGMGSLHRAWSSDGGETWSAPEATSLTSACSSLTLRRMPDDRLIVVYNHAEPLAPGAFFPRTPLTYAVSDDDGETWSEPFCIDAEGAEHNDCQNIYPSICFTDEGILVVYSTHAADPQGTFSNGGPEGWRIGGGKSCVLAYPCTGKGCPGVGATGRKTRAT